MDAIVLAAGFGTRLRPLTDETAKPLLPVAGRPVLSRVLEDVRQIKDLSSIVIVANGRFHEDFRSWSRTEPKGVPIKVLNDGAMNNEGRLGALRDLEFGLAALKTPQPLLVVGGDNLFPPTLGRAAARYRENTAIPLLLVRKLDEPVPPNRYSEITLDPEGTVVSFREKPDNPESLYSAICGYFFPAAVRTWLEQYFSDGGNEDATGHFLAWLCARGRLRAELVIRPIFDIGTKSDLESADRHFRMQEHP